MITRIDGKTILAIVLAGGRGKRLSPLTDERAKPAVPFLGTYKLIDFSLSNLVHSGLHDIWVVVQYMPHGLSEHLSGGRPWDLDRTRGGLKIMPPFSDVHDEEGEFAQGNAHALAQHAHLIAHYAPDLVMVLSADHIYKMDLSQVVSAHIAKRASVTMVTTEVKVAQEATRFGNLKTDQAGKVTQFAYKPDEPLGRSVTAEIFVYDTTILLNTLQELSQEGDLGDYGEQLLPRLVQRGDAYAYPLAGYWMDVGTLEAYLQAHRDFIDGQGFDLAAAEWPFLTASVTTPPARIDKTALIDQSLIGGGASIAGEVRRSVVAPHVHIEAGAVVTDSVILEGAIIRAGAKVSRSIVDVAAEVGQGATVGGQAANSRPTVLGARSKVAAGAHIGPARFVAVQAAVSAGQEDEQTQALAHDNKSGKAES